MDLYRLDASPQHRHEKDTLKRHYPTAPPEHLTHTSLPPSPYGQFDGPAQSLQAPKQIHNLHNVMLFLISTGY